MSIHAYYLILIFSKFTNSAFIIEKISYDSAPGYVNINKCVLNNDGINDSSIDVEFELVKSIENARLDYKMFIQDSKSDRKFSRQIYSISFDIKKSASKDEGKPDCCKFYSVSC